jgi:dephospho-CoA kinase
LYIIDIEAALIFESGFDKYLDYTVAVTSSVKNRVERIKRRSKLTVKTIKSIMKLQMPENEKKAKADFVIINDSIPQELQNKVSFVFTVLKTLFKNV